MDDAAQPLLPVADGRSRRVAPRSRCARLPRSSRSRSTSRAGSAHGARRAFAASRHGGIVRVARGGGERPPARAARAAHRARDARRRRYERLWLPEHRPAWRDANIDRLAASGVKLANLYGQQLCTPARAHYRASSSTASGSGRPPSSRAPTRPRSRRTQLLDPAGAALLPQRLSDAGYSTRFGKWNVGHCNSRTCRPRAASTPSLATSPRASATRATRRPAVTVPGGTNGEPRVGRRPRHVRRRDGLARDERRIRRPRQRRDLRERGDRDDRGARARSRAARATAARSGRGSRFCVARVPAARTTTRLRRRRGQRRTRRRRRREREPRGRGARARARARAPEPRRKLAQRMLTLDSLIGLVDSLRDAGRSTRPCSSCTRTTAAGRAARTSRRRATPSAGRSMNSSRAACVCPAASMRPACSRAQRDRRAQRGGRDPRRGRRR